MLYGDAPLQVSFLLYLKLLDGKALPFDISIYHKVMPKLL